jgi:hypothetical protein
MWLNFWLNNFHFASEFFGAVVLFALAWLAFDSFLIKKNFKTLSPCLGFMFFAFWLIVNSLNVANDIVLFIADISYLLGLILIFLNLYLEKPLARPKFEMVLVLPAAAGVLFHVNAIATVIMAAIIAIAFKRYYGGLQKSLKAFWIGFSFLFLGSIFATLGAKTQAQDAFWILRHIFEFSGFLSLAVWAWQFLKVRIKEEMLLIFVSMALFIGIIVTFTFSAILLKNMETEAQTNLISNVKMLDYSILRMEKEALSNAQLFSSDKTIADYLEKSDFAGLENTAGRLMAEKEMDFLTIADKNGEVVLRAHSVTAKGDNIQGEDAGGRALSGQSYVTVESPSPEKFSIRGAAPIFDGQNNIIGAVITGFVIDNAFADKIKKVTGLEATIYNNDAVAATTIFDPTGKTRNTDVKQTDASVLSAVLIEGKAMTGRTVIFSKPYLAAYLPVQNAGGKTVGMLQTFRPETEIVEAAASTNRLTLFITIIIVLMMLMPAYWIAKKITEEF